MASEFRKQPLISTPGNQPYGRSGTEKYPFETVAVFYLASESRDALERWGMEETEIDALLDEGMTKYLITSFQEQHNEGYNVMNPVADTYGIYTTGAMPIQVAMDGFLYMTQDQDYRLDFITYYLSLLRGSFLRREKLTAVFMLKDTMMRLRIQDMNITHTSKIQDFAQMSIAGIGFSYQVYTGSFG